MSNTTQTDTRADAPLSKAGPASSKTARVRRTIRPTRMAALLFGLAVLPALPISTGFPDFWYTSLYLPCVVLMLLLADAVMALPDNRLEAEVHAPSRLAVGEAGRIRLRLAAENDTRPVRIETLLEQEGDADPPHPAIGTLRDGVLELGPTVTPRRRGRILLKALWLRRSGPLGFVSLCRRQPLDQSIDVVPNVHGIHETALRFFAEDAVYGLKSQRMRGEGTEFETLCEYMPGMDHRFIDWKRSARHRKLLCKEFRHERNHPVVFGFDTGRLMLEPVNGVPRLDHAIRAGLLLGWISLHSGDLVGGCGFDARFRHFLKPGRGMPYFSQFQRFTAGLEYRPEETNFTLGLTELEARLQRRSLVVLFTEFVDTITAELLLESLQRMTRRHVVVFVTMRDPLTARLRDAAPHNFTDTAQAVVADDFLRERAVVLERLARLGVHCLDVPAEDISGAVLNKYLMIKQRGLL